MLGMEDFQRWVGYRVGDGRRVHFWSDIWGGDQCLSSRFPRVFGLAMDKREGVADYLERGDSGGQVFWNVRLRRNLMDEEVGLFADLLGELYKLRGIGVGEDEIRWLGFRSGVFSVSSFYQLLARERFVEGPWRVVWLTGITPKVSFFVWTAALNRILTIDNLMRRGWVMVNRCCMCGLAEETVDHLLLHCIAAYQLWSLVYSIFGIVWVQPGSVASVLWSWAGGRVGKRRRKAWLFVPHCLMWLIWLERNRRTFQDTTVLVSQLKSRFVSILLSWVFGRVEPDVSSFLNFIDDLVG